MSARRFIRSAVFGGRRSGQAGAVVATATIVNLLAAFRALEPSASPGSATKEIGAALAIGVLILTAAGVASSARRVLRVPVTRNRLGLLGGAVLRCIAGSVSAVGLTLPALVMVWDGGASGAEVGSLALTVTGAVGCGSALGLLFAAGGLRVPAAAVTAAASGALCLWPASLGWATAGVGRFPAVETPLLLLLAVVSVAALIGARALVIREAIR